MTSARPPCVPSLKPTYRPGRNRAGPWTAGRRDEQWSICSDATVAQISERSLHGVAPALTFRIPVGLPINDRS